MDDHEFKTNHRGEQWEQLIAQLNAAYKEMEPTLASLGEPAAKFAHGHQDIAHQFIDVVPNVLQHMAMMTEEYRSKDMDQLREKLGRYADVSSALLPHVVESPKLDAEQKAVLWHQLSLFQGRMSGVSQEIALTENAAEPTVAQVVTDKTLDTRGDKNR